MEQALLDQIGYNDFESRMRSLNDYMSVQENGRMDRRENLLTVAGVLLAAGGGVALAFVTRSIVSYT